MGDEINEDEQGHTYDGTDDCGVIVQPSAPEKVILECAAGTLNLAKQGEKTMTKTAQKTKTATTTDPSAASGTTMNSRFSRSRTKRKSCSNFLRPHGTPRSSTT